MPSTTNEGIQPKQHKILLIMRRDIHFFFVLLCVLQPFSTLYAQVTIGSDRVPSRAALLDLKTQADSNPAEGGVTSTKGGLLLPRVILEETKSLKPFISNGGSNAEKAAHKGMNVYHIGGNGIGTGQYVWDGTQWLLLLTEVPPTPLNSIRMYYQTHNIMGGTGGPSNHNGMIPLEFSETGNVDAPVTIRLPEDGSYAFNVKLYSRICDDLTGKIKSSAYSGKVVIYVSVWVNDEIYDISEIFSYIGVMAHGKPTLYNQNVTNVILGCTGKKGDVVDIRLGYDQQWLPEGDAVLSQGLISDVPYSARTSMIFWKL